MYPAASDPHRAARCAATDLTGACHKVPAVEFDARNLVRKQAHVRKQQPSHDMRRESEESASLIGAFVHAIVLQLFDFSELHVGF